MSTKELVMLPGPVEVDPQVLLASALPMFNHRGQRFTELYKSIKAKIQLLVQSQGQVYLITASGTGGNEFAAQSLIAHGDKVVVCTNGFFGDRLYDTYRSITPDAIELKAPWGKPIDLDALEKTAKDADVVALVFNETSTGVRNQVRQAAQIAKEYGAICVVDNVSGVGNEYSMDSWEIDVTVLASQKGIAAPPGVSFAVFSDEAREKAKRSERRSQYFNFDLFEKSAEDSQTPATPAIGTLMAVDQALTLIEDEGIEAFVRRHKLHAEAFRTAVEALGLDLFADREYVSNTVTAVRIPSKAKQVVDFMRTKYGVVVATGLGEYSRDVIRVGHMGRVDAKDIMATVGALELSLAAAGFSIKPGAGVGSLIEFYKNSW